MRMNRRLTAIASTVAVVAGAGTAVWFASAAPGPPAEPGDTVSASAGVPVARQPYVHTRPEDDKNGANGKVTLRSCPQAGADKPVGQNPWSLHCMALESLDNETTVTMHCWVSTVAPPDEKPTKDEQGRTIEPSAKWFKVTVTSGSAAGRQGWVWSDLVREQTDGTSECASIGYEKDPPAPPPEPLVFDVTGTCTTQRGELSSRSARFTPGGEYAISATRPDGSPYPLDGDSGTVAADGSVVWKWPCANDPAGTYTTELVDYSTGRTVEDSFTIGQAHTQAPASSSSPTPPPTQKPVSRKLTVSNQVTNGPTLMREDVDHPAYLSTVTRNRCAANGCALPGTELRTGDVITVVCRTDGDRTTNGEDGNARDDGNPGLDETHVWYGIRWSDGRFGYISAIWIEPGLRDGLGLPAC